MARIVLSTIGTRGDLNPFLAIGDGLRKRGHEVVFAIENVLAPLVVREGFAVSPLAGDVMSSLAPHVGRLVGGLTPVPSIRMMFKHWLQPTLRTKVDDLVTVCSGADMIVARSGHLAASMAAELTGIPRVQIALTPLTFRSAYVDPQLLPFERPRRLPKAVNRLAWSAVAAWTRRLADRGVNEVRIEYGLGPLRDVIGVSGRSDILTALVVSAAFMPPLPDWPENARVVGYCFWDTPLGWREPEPLTAFLRSGPAAVAVSFGSLSPFVGAALRKPYRVAVRAILESGNRALVIGAPTGTWLEPLPADVLSIPFAPFSKVFPRCLAVIHHGGTYTVGEALRAGIPSLAIPWGIDQFFNSAQLSRIGAGHWIHHRLWNRLTAGWQLQRLLADTAVRPRAEAIQKDVAREDGVATLCAAIESALSERLSPSRT